MVYTVDIWCDGACRNNGRRGVPVLGGWGVYSPRYPSGEVAVYGPLLTDLDQGNTSATSNRAELHALIKALECARDAYKHLRFPDTTVVECNIHLDSSYTKRCLTEWIYKWQENGWRTNTGEDVKNRDLILRAVSLENSIRERNDEVYYIKIDRSNNGTADELANDGCDMAAERYSRGYRY